MRLTMALTVLCVALTVLCVVPVLTNRSNQPSQTTKEQPVHAEKQPGRPQLLPRPSPPPPPPAPPRRRAHLHHVEKTGKALSDWLNSTALQKLFDAHSRTYHAVAPFPHTLVNGFLPESVIQSLAAELPEPDPDHLTSNNCPLWRPQCGGTKGLEERKSALLDWNLMGPHTRQFFSALKSPPFLRLLEGLTGIRPLLPDPDFHGSGVHMTAPGGYLQVHADFNKLFGDKDCLGPNVIHRRVNVFLFFNDDWREEWGGHLELWNRNMSACQQRISPLWNRFVVFSSTDFSYHGHPTPMQLPRERWRRSLALYYYTKSRPHNECLHPNCAGLHTTLFQ